MSLGLRVVAGAVGFAVGVGAVVLVREATLSTHQPVPADSRTEVVIDVDTRNRERNQRPDEMAAALFTFCRLEVFSDLVGDVDALGGGRYRAVLTPALDETNRRQFRGCLQDWTLDSLRARVVSLESRPAP